MSMNCFGMTFSIVLHFLLLANYPSCKYLKKEEIISSFRSLIMLYNCKCRAKFKHNCFGMTFFIVLQQPAQLSVGPTPPTRPATPSPHPTVSSRLGGGEDMPSITRFMDM